MNKLEHPDGRWGLGSSCMVRGEARRSCMVRGLPKQVQVVVKSDGPSPLADR